MRPESIVVCLLFALLFAGCRPDAARAQARVTPADRAQVLLEAARGFEAEGRWEIAEALYQHIVARYGATPAATAAGARLTSAPANVAYGDGTVELTVWMTLYGAWLGVAIPGALGVDSPEPYGVGLLAGGPTGFLAGRGLARSLRLTEGQARAITLGGTWGSWQGFGWREVFDWGVAESCDVSFGIEYCYDSEDNFEETFAAMVVGGLAGIGVGALLSNRDITPGTATAVNFGSLWGTWFGVAGGILMDLEGDDLLAAALVGGDVALVSTALLAPGWNVSRSRARIVSIAGLLGGLGGAGIDLIAQPDDEKVAVAIPLVGSVAGLLLGIAATRDTGPDLAGVEASVSGALLRVEGGRVRLGLPTLFPTLVPHDGPHGTSMRPALGLELVGARF